VTLSFQIPTGTNLVLEMSASGGSFAGSLLQGPGSVSSGSLVDMGNTLAWGGMPQVWDAIGAPVATYSMVGLGSGFDFRNAYVSAVPEPSAALLLAGGLAGLVGLAHRRGLPPAPRNSRSRSTSASNAAR
jgi:hypothetical protein